MNARHAVRRTGHGPPRTRRARRICRRTTERGLSLIELIVAITIVAAGVTAVLGAHAAIATRSADAMVRQQAVAIAESYLEEIGLKPFADPDGVDGETARGSFDDVDDYDALDDNGIRDQNGTAIAALSSYRATVSVVATAALSGVASSAARRIDVTVTGPQNVRVTLSAYRTAW